MSENERAFVPAIVPAAKAGDVVNGVRLTEESLRAMSGDAAVRLFYDEKAKGLCVILDLYGVRDVKDELLSECDPFPAGEHSANGT